ncbi:MAG TPA: transketolase [Sphaerochaeta sp.]|nr:MAG: transketolase [Spirochaetes bacterium GWC2_52_13]HCG62899.1 transketolase [Sphaerochaeta sp.]HCJ94646.1 transketolase [Sphaerochaeta sp.]HCS36636.1 transketolase [Sphaerochaeta sp.]
MADIAYLQDCARRIRKDVVEMVYRTKDGHPSPSFSVAEILAALYFHILRIDPENPKWEDRDRFILSKGHACPALYAALARRGYFSPDELTTLRYLHSNLQGHPYEPKTPGLDSTTGSLGNGVSIGLGMAMAARIRKQDYRVYVITGDGELGEGLIWEAAMAAGHHKMANLTVFVDNNNYQSGGTVGEISGPYPIAEKWADFGWHTQTIDGHDIAQILEAVEQAKLVVDRPSVIVAKTVKGQGLSFMVGDNTWHKRVYTDAEYEQAMVELGGTVCK